MSRAIEFLAALSMGLGAACLLAPGCGGSGHDWPPIPLAPAPLLVVGSAYVATGSDLVWDPGLVSTPSWPHAWGEPAPSELLVGPIGTLGQVEIPSWLDLPINAEAKARVLDELVTAPVEADPRLDPALRGFPSGWQITVLDPGAFWAPQSPTGLASGVTDIGARHTWLATRGSFRDPTMLPAAPHEARLAWTGDPTAGEGTYTGQ